MTQYLPPNLLQLFTARDEIPFLPPADKLPHEKKSRGYLGVGNFLNFFEDPKDTPPCTRVETRAERLERRRREKAEQVAYKLEREIATWDTAQIVNATEDPFRTLFVSRINYDTSESKLRREFEIYGAIKKIVMITDSEEGGKPRGYAFIEYEHERDMHSAYKHADGKKIDGKRVLVDVERARTVKGWLPRRLGGGLGGTRRGGADVNIKHSGREDNERERERYRLEREIEDVRGKMDHRDRGDHRGMPAGGLNNDRGRFDNRRRSRSRDRGREVRERSRHRSRSRERRKRRGSRDREYEEGGAGPEKRERREKERDRDRDRDSKKKKRSKSRDRDRSEKKRDRRDRDRDRGDKERKPDMIKVKEEPVDDYPQFNMPMNYPLKNEDEEEVKYRPPPQEQFLNQPPPNGQGNSGSASGDGNTEWWRKL